MPKDPFLRSLFSVIIIVIVTVFPGVGCSTYTLTRITAAEAGSDFPEGATYRVTPPKAFLIRSSSSTAIGFGEPALELERYCIPEIGHTAIHEVPAGTIIKIERYVRFNQHGWVCCGSNGWEFAIASIFEGPLRGTHFLIDTFELNHAYPNDGLLQPPY